jgi:indoleamine 2,3-dioxygenase
MTLTTLLSISDLEGFDVSPVLGFVPLEGLMECLPPSHVAVEDLVQRPELPEAIRSFVLREKVAAFPSNLDFMTLTTAQLRRAMVILSFVAHAYIWGNEMATPLSELPKQLAVPLVQIGGLLGIAPLGTYATTVLWNCRLAVPQVGWTKENVMIDFTFTGTEDEKLFYNIR